MNIKTCWGTCVLCGNMKKNFLIVRPIMASLSSNFNELSSSGSFCLSALRDDFNVLRRKETASLLEFNKLGFTESSRPYAVPSLSLFSEVTALSWPSKTLSCKPKWYPRIFRISRLLLNWFDAGPRFHTGRLGASAQCQNCLLYKSKEKCP